MTTLAIGIDLLLVLGLVFFFSKAGSLFGPKPAHEWQGEEPYETGMLPVEPAIGKMAVLYWRFALLFVVFDVDLVFLLPWALARRDLDTQHLISVTGFVAILVFMLLYFWRKGALECEA